MNVSTPLFLISYCLLWAITAAQSLALIRLLRNRRNSPAERTDRTAKPDKESPAGPEIGVPAPAFTATLLGTDRTFESAELRGTRMLLAVVAAGCGTCTTALPALRNTARRTGRRLTFVCIGPEDGCERYSSDDAIVLSDPRGQIVRTFGISSIPYVAALDENGVITAAGGAATGDDVWEFAELAEDDPAPSSGALALATNGAHRPAREQEGIR